MGGRAGQRRVAEPGASHCGSYALFTGIQHHFPAVSHVCYQPYKHMGKIASNKAAACALTLPYLGVIGLLVSNLFTHSIFTFVDGVYTTMPLSFLPYTMASINILISIAYIIIYRRLFTVRKLIALIMMLPVMVCIIISKIIFTDTMVMVFGNTVGVVIIAVMIQRPENSSTPSPGYASTVPTPQALSTTRSTRR